MNNGYFESFTGEFRDECLNEHWSQTLPQARAVIGVWSAGHGAKTSKLLANS